MGKSAGRSRAQLGDRDNCAIFLILVEGIYTREFIFKVASCETSYDHAVLQISCGGRNLGPSELFF